jgi:hypothetical protein
VTLKYPSGALRRISVGDTVFFPAGTSAEWTVESYVRKLAFCRTPVPRYLTALRQVARRVKRAVRGGSVAAETSGLL